MSGLFGHGRVDSIFNVQTAVFSFPIPLAQRTGSSLSWSISSSLPFSCERRCRAVRCLFEETLWNLLSLQFNHAGTLVQMGAGSVTAH